MRNLVKTDLARVLKDKLLIVVLILAVVFALITPLLYVVLFSSMEMPEGLGMETLVSAKAQFFSSFSLGNNFGLVVPVLIAIILCKDFSFGTVRNKIISGHSRSSIFFSMFITCAIVLWIIILFHALLTLGVSLIFFEYQSDDFGMKDFWYLLESLAFQMLVFIFVAALVSWLCAAMKNVGLVIVLYVAIMLAMTMIASILMVVISALQFDPQYEGTVKVLEFIQKLNIFNFASIIGQGSEYSAKDTLCLLLTPALGTAAFLGLGCMKFTKKDLK